MPILFLLLLQDLSTSCVVHEVLQISQFYKIHKSVLESLSQ